MSRKSKGINAERELIHFFYDNDWSAIRVAGSGSSQYPSPDLLVGNDKDVLAFEVKISRKKKKYINKKEIEELVEFATGFGAKPLIAMKFNYNPWYIMETEELKKTGACYLISLEKLKENGTKMTDFVKKHQNEIFKKNK